MIAPILRDLPETFETERLVLSSFHAGTGAAMHEAVMESMDSLLAWLPWARRDYTEEQSEENARANCAKYMTRSDLALRMLLKTAGTVVGVIALHPKWHVPKFEIGYWCRTSFEGKGYVTEAVRALTAFALTGLAAKRVEIRCDSRNLRSRRVAERAGFRLEAELRNDDIAVDGALRNTCVFARLPE